MVAVDAVEIVITRIEDLAEGVRELWLSRCNGEPFAPTVPGDSIRLSLPSGLERNYSLVGAAGIHDELAIAVALHTDGLGGSKEVFTLVPGDKVAVRPGTSFGLDDSDESCVFFAGGIGITPIWSMIQACEASGRPWQLYYAAKRPERAAFLAELTDLEQRRGGRVHLAFSEHGDRLNLASILADVGEGAGVYGCGPHVFVEAFTAASQHLGARSHREDFSAATVASGGFEVQLARTGRSVFVPDGSSILEVLLDEGLEPDYSCMSGTCGTCQIAVLAGVPDHQDFVLTDDEKLSNTTMMICCSGCRSGSLVLDI